MPALHHLLLFLTASFALATPLWAQPNAGEESLANTYYNEGEYERALELYQRLYKRTPGIDLYIYRIVDAHLAVGNAQAALTFCTEIIRKHPSRPQFKALKGKAIQALEGPEAAKEYWAALIGADLQTQPEFASVGSFFTSNRLFQQAIATYERARERLSAPLEFLPELAMLYQATGQTQKAVAEYIALLAKDASQLGPARASILRMTTDENQLSIEQAILQAQGRFPQNGQVLELLYAFYLHIRDFEGALAQARAMDLRNREGGSRVFTLAQTLQANQAWALSNQALRFIIERYPNSNYFLLASLELAKNYELEAFSRKPLDTAKVRQAVANYDNLFADYGRGPVVAEAMFRKANLCVFYLNDLESALAELQHIERLAIPPIKKAEAQLLVGDIHLLRAEYLNAQNKYEEVERAFREAQVGAQARFRLARLSYYKGDFLLAQGRLKVLKDNTSNDIANDAIRLFLTIQDNIGMDSSTVPLGRFAHAELLAFQHLFALADTLLDSIAHAHPGHPLTDDILWAKANICLAQNRLPEAMVLLANLVDNHATSVLADDALFSMAEIQQFTLNNGEKAHALYMRLLVDFPASLYKVEARKRIRQLRGDHS